MADEIEDLITNVESMTADGFKTGELQHFSVRSLHLRAELSQIALRLLTEPSWEPSEVEKHYLGRLMLAAHEAETGETFDPSGTAALVENYLKAVRKLRRC